MQTPRKYEELEEVAVVSNEVKSPAPHKEAPNPIHPVLWKLLLLLGVLVYGSYSILMHLCEVDGRMPFSSASLVLVIEVAKLMISVCLYLPEHKRLIEQRQFQWPTWQEVLPFSVPAVLYMVNNNLAIYIQLQMDPATYQVLGNLKILTTAVLFRIIIKKPITNIQWIALFMLIAAGVCNSVGNYAPESVIITEVNATPMMNMNKSGTLHITMIGLVMISVYCLISGFTGVYTEFVLKSQREMSLHLQNAFLYVFGSALNAIFFLYQVADRNDTDPNAGLDLFRGYTVYTWLVVITQAFCGLLMGAIMKHANNITRLFLISSAILVTTVLSVIIFHLHLNMYFIVAAALVIGALYLYHR